MATFVDMIERVASQAPGRSAVNDGETELTYGALAAHSTTFARRLISEGIRPHDRVAFVCDRGVSPVVAILGILKSGAVYVPLDPHNPPSRMRRILTDLRPSLIVGPSPHLKRIPLPDARSLILPRFGPEWESSPEPYTDTPLPLLDEKAVAYCIFTSGSTGEPRGVEIRHRSIVAFLEALAPHLRLGNNSRFLNTSPYHFDVSVADVFLPLALGTTVYVARSVLPPCRVLEQIEEARITHFCPPAPLLTLLCGPGSTFEQRDLTSLECVMTGAEVVTPWVVGRWLKAHPTLRILNAYGPTEATCACLAHEVTAEDFDESREISIGRPFEGVDAMLVDPSTGLPSNGHDGELAIAGTQLMRGYFNRPSETAARMLTIHGRSYYRTGDLCEVDSHGRYFFRGRRDDEIKIRGYRVNLEEIRRAVLDDDQVREAIVGLVEVRHMAPGLGLALVMKNSGSLGIAPAGVLKRLSDQLPTYMIPQYAMVCDEFARLPSGKTNTRGTLHLLSQAVGTHKSKFMKLEAGTVSPLGFD